MMEENLHLPIDSRTASHAVRRGSTRNVSLLRNAMKRTGHQRRNHSETRTAVAPLRIAYRKNKRPLSSCSIEVARDSFIRVKEA
jgi:hypothetical protein